MKVKEFATVVSGATPSSKCSEYYDGDIAWFTPKDLSDQGTKHVSQCERYITKAGYDSCSTTMLPAGSVLMSSRAPIGLVAIADVPCCTNQGFKSFDVDRSKCDPEYLYYYLKLHIKEVESLGSGTTFKEVSKESVENYDVMLPDLDVQQKIISVLRDIDSKIANNNAICSNLEAMAKLLYDYWFVQFDFPDENGKPYKSSGGKMIWNDELKREIPAGWEVKSFREIASFTMGQSPKGDNYNTQGKGLPLLNGAVELAKGGIHKAKYTEEYNRVCENGDWLFCVRATLGNIHLADDKYCLGRGVASATPIAEIYKELVYFNLLNMIAYFEKALSGSIIIGMTKDDITDYPIICPSESVVKAFHHTIQDVFYKKELVERENQQLTSLRDFLLPMLMNGQVKV